MEIAKNVIYMKKLIINFKQKYMKQILLSTSLFLSVGFLNAQSIPQLNQEADLKKATIYLNGAVLEHQTKLTLPAGQSEVVIRNVANQIIDESLQVGISKGATILNVNFRRWQPTQEEILQNKTNASAEWIQAQAKLKQIQQEKQAVEATLQMLAKTTMSSEGGQQTAAQWNAITDSYLKKQRVLLKEVEEWRQKERDQNIIIQRLQNEGQANLNQQLGEVVLQVQAKQSMNAQIEFQYITNAASWQPEYELSTEDQKSTLQLQFKGAVQQNTGINWNKIPLVLATSDPMSYTSIPQLSPWFLGFVQPVNITAQRSAAPTMMAKGRTNVQADGIMQESLDYGGMQNHVVLEEGQMFNEYVIQLPTSLASSNQSQSLTLEQSQIPITKEYLVIPRQSQAVHLVAKVVAKDQKSSLPGNATILHNNKYIGKTYFNPRQLQDTLNISLGTDQRIQVKREKVNDWSSKKVLGTRKVDEYGFKITLENQKNESVKIKVQEQVPISRVKDLEITYPELNNGFLDEKKGIITWEVELAPNQIKSVQYSVKLRYPNSQEVQDLY